jgi:hypothetical protein
MKCSSLHLPFHTGDQNLFSLGPTDIKKIKKKNQNNKTGSINFGFQSPGVEEKPGNCKNAETHALFYFGC